MNVKDADKQLIQEYNSEEIINMFYIHTHHSLSS